MGVHNGYVENGDLFHNGDITWADLSSWSAYTQWTSYTSTGNQSVSGATGTPLRYQTSIIDLGSVKNVFPEIIVGCDGTAKTVIEYSSTSSDLSSSTTTVGAYTSDNTVTGTYNQTYGIVDYASSGYSDSAYTGFSARYVRVTVFVEKFSSATTRGNPALYNLQVNLKDQELEHEYLFDLNTTDLAGNANARTIPISSRISTPVLGIFYSTKYDASTSGANGKYQIHTISKSTPSFAVFDLDKFNDTAGVDLDGIDIHVVGYPEAVETESGSIVRKT